MTLMTRMARLVRADLNAVLDRLEAPDQVLAQAVREMELALDQGRRRIADLDRALERLALREAALAADEARLAGALAEGLTDGREALARPLIRRRLESGRRRAALQTRHTELAGERDRLAELAVARAARLADLRARAALYGDGGDRPAADHAADEGWTDAWSGPDPSVSDAEVELELLRLRRQGAGS
jgi:phage shock protein A